MNHKKTLLLTGGSKGIGRATVEHFLQGGWRVVFVARSLDGIVQATEELEADGYGSDVVRGLKLDVGDLDAVEAFPSICPFLENGLDGLVLNAFYQKITPAHALTREDLDSHWRINNLSPIALINAAFGHLKRARGSVAYIGSITDERGSPGYAAYGASKAYMRAFVRQAAIDYGRLGVRINTVSPGCIRTDALKRAIKANGVDQAEDILKQIPLENRYGEPAEIAEAIWFAITGPRYFHGRDLRVDGGLI